MSDWNITLELDEETRARWLLAAAREQYDLVDWIRETCQVASDPESGRVVAQPLWPGAGADEADYSQETP